eukprot:365913-Chlamydomonas_euryale.AAC.5
MGRIARGEVRQLPATQHGRQLPSAGQDEGSATSAFHTATSAMRPTLVMCQVTFGRTRQRQARLCGPDSWASCRCQTAHRTKGQRRCGDVWDAWDGSGPRTSRSVTGRSSLPCTHARVQQFVRHTSGQVWTAHYLYVATQISRTSCVEDC